MNLDELITTGQAAKYCSVTPDAVLKWIRAGRLPAQRTPGGHHRIKRRDLVEFVNSNAKTEVETKSQSVEASATRRPSRRVEGGPGEVRYCWEFKSGGKSLEVCSECIVYQMRARRCYEVVRSSAEGHARRLCKTSCEECDYYKHVHQQATNVLVVTDDEGLAVALKHDVGDARFSLDVANCEYTTSAMVEDCRPDYVVIDCSVGEERSRDIANHLLADPRIPFVKVVMATNDGSLPDGCDKEIFAHIKKPLHAKDLTKVVGTALESAQMEEACE